MRSNASRTLCLFCGLLLFGACDRMPLDAALGDDAVDLLAGTGGSTIPLPLSTPGLLGTALLKLYADEGAAAVWTRAAELRRLHDSAQAAAAAGDDAAAARLAADARAEELRIVLETLGTGTIDQVLEHAGPALTRLRLQIADGTAAGADLASVATAAAEVESLLQRTRAAHEAGGHEAALDAATRAVARLEDARQLAADIAGTPSIEALFERALERIAATHGTAAAEARATAHRRLVAEARAAVLGGRTNIAHARVTAARTEAIAVVIETFGEQVAAETIAAVGERLERARSAAAGARRAGVDTVEFERMERSARDLEMRAAAELRAGDPAAALDLGSHAAGLVEELLLRLATRH